MVGPIIKSGEVKAWIEKRSNIDYRLYIKTPYNADFIQDLKNNVEKRRWDSWKKSWEVKITTDAEDAIKAINLVEKHFEVDLSELKQNLPRPRANGIVLRKDDETIVFEIDYDKNFINAVKKLKATFNNRTKRWELRLRDLKTVESVDKIVEEFKLLVTNEAKVVIENARKKFLEEKCKLEELLELSKATKVPKEFKIELPNPELQLYDYQKVGVLWLEKTGGNALIADEMGLGKTVQVLAWLYNHRELRPVLVVCPTSVKFNWIREIEKWTGEKAVLIKGKTKKNGKIKKGVGFYVINYDILSSRLDELKEIGFKVLVLDEAHYIKNTKAKRTKAALELAKQTEKVIALTGTPLLNKPIELWPILVAVKHFNDDKKTFWWYAKRYCDFHYEQYGRKIVTVFGASNLDELQVRLRTSVRIRRLKKDVLSQLPAKRRIMVTLEADLNEYNKVLKEFWDWLQEKGAFSPAKALVELEKLRKAAVEGKLKQATRFINDTVENEGKVVVFAYHKEVIEKLVTELEKNKELSVFKITGGMSAEEKQKAIDAFNSAEKAVIVVSVRAGAEGINLQTAKTAVFVELDWTPATLLQAEGRLHRVGQEKQVDVYYLIAKDTVEEKMWEALNKKFEIVKKALDTAEDTEDIKITVDVIKELVEERGDKLKLVEGTSYSLHSSSQAELTTQV